MPVMKSSRLILSLFLAFTLLVAQFGAYAHAISHTIADQTQDQSLPHDKHCDLCAAYAQIGGAISVSLIHFDFTTSFEESLTAYFTSFRSVAFTAFAARAPPRSA
jgi:hypothetical protein